MAEAALQTIKPTHISTGNARSPFCLFLPSLGAVEKQRVLRVIFVKDITSISYMCYQADKAVAETKLAAAAPALAMAESALQTIKPAHISTGSPVVLSVDKWWS